MLRRLSSVLLSIHFIINHLGCVLAMNEITPTNHINENAVVHSISSWRPYSTFDRDVKNLIKDLQKVKVQRLPTVRKENALAQIFKNIPVDKAALRNKFLMFDENLKSVTYYAIREYDWEMMAQIGVFYPDTAVSAFMATFGESLSPDQITKRANIFAVMFSIFRPKLVSARWKNKAEMTFFMDLYASVLGMSAKYGEKEIVRVLMDEDWFNIQGVQLLIDESSAKCKFDLIFCKGISHVKSKRFFWVLFSTRVALEFKKYETADLLLSYIKADLETEKVFLKSIAQEYSLNKDWDGLILMVPYARIIALKALLDNGYTRYISNYLPHFIPESVEEKLEVYKVILYSDAIDQLDQKLIEQIKLGLDEELIQNINEDWYEQNDLYCQVCMESNINCYFSCQGAKEFKHGACRSCYEKVWASDNPSCPFCRKPLRGIFDPRRFFE